MTEGKRIAIVTDTWHPKPDGIVRATQQFKTQLEKRGWWVYIIHPGLFSTVPLPYYRELKMAIAPGRRLSHLLKDFGPDYVHIMTEGQWIDANTGERIK